MNRAFSLGPGLYGAPALTSHVGGETNGGLARSLLLALFARLPSCRCVVPIAASPAARRTPCARGRRLSTRRGAARLRRAVRDRRQLRRRARPRPHHALLSQERFIRHPVAPQRPRTRCRGRRRDPRRARQERPLHPPGPALARTAQILEQATPASRENLTMTVTHDHSSPSYSSTSGARGRSRTSSTSASSTTTRTRTRRRSSRQPPTSGPCASAQRRAFRPDAPPMGPGWPMTARRRLPGPRHRPRPFGRPLRVAEERGRSRTSSTSRCTPSSSMATT